MKGAAQIKDTLRADAGSFGVSSDSVEGVLLPWQMMSILEMKGQAAVDRK